MLIRTKIRLNDSQFSISEPTRLFPESFFNLEAEKPTVHVIHVLLLLPGFSRLYHTDFPVGPPAESWADRRPEVLTVALRRTEVK